MRSQLILGTLITATLVLALGAVAHAVTLRTPFVVAGNSQKPVCSVTNVGKKPTDVEVVIVSSTGTNLVPDFDECNGFPLDPRHTCSVTLSTGADAYCEIKAKKKITASVYLFNVDTNAVDLMTPATKK